MSAQNNPHGHRNVGGVPSLKKTSSQLMLDTTYSMLQGDEFVIDRSLHQRYTTKYTELAARYNQLPHGSFTAVSEACRTNPERNEVKAGIKHLHDQVETSSASLRDRMNAVPTPRTSISSGGWSTPLTNPSFGHGSATSGINSPPNTGGTGPSGHSGWPSTGGYPTGPGSGAEHAQSPSVSSSVSHVTTPSVHASSTQSQTQYHAGGSTSTGYTVFQQVSHLPNFTPTNNSYNGVIAVNGQYVPVQVFRDANGVLAYQTQYQSQVIWVSVKVVG